MRLRKQVLLFVCVVAALLTSHSVVSGGIADAGQAMLSQGVEDDESFLEREEAAYPRRRVLYDPRSIGYGALLENKAACYGPCPGRGQAYTGRGCQNIYGCRG